MKFTVLTLFPEMIRDAASASILGKAADKNLIDIQAVDIRSFSRDKNHRVDDYTYGGGAGMLIQAQPVFDAHTSVSGGRAVRTIYVTPQGKPFTQADARNLALEEELIFLCGHYEGIDERVLEEVVTDRFSIGDYVLTGGELPSLVMIDAIARLVSGVLGNETSAEVESFDRDLLEYPQYTRPVCWHEKEVPSVLLSGNLKDIAKWRLEKSEELTKRVRPDLYEAYNNRQELINDLIQKKKVFAPFICALQSGDANVVYLSGSGIKMDLLLYLREAQMYMAYAQNSESAVMLSKLIPKDFPHMVMAQSNVAKALVENGFHSHCEVLNAVYTKKEHAPRCSRTIRPLALKDLSYVCERYEHGDRDYIASRLKKGMVYGAFEEERILGFIGIHQEGSIGMLFVEEAYRGQGIAYELESFMINLRMDTGFLPFGQIIVGNEASFRLQDKLGLYISDVSYEWMSL